MHIQQCGCPTTEAADPSISGERTTGEAPASRGPGAVRDRALPRAASCFPLILRHIKDRLVKKIGTGSPLRLLRRLEVFIGSQGQP